MMSLIKEAVAAAFLAIPVGFYGAAIDTINHDRANIQSFVPGTMEAIDVSTHTTRHQEGQPSAAATVLEGVATAVDFNVIEIDNQQVVLFIADSCSNAQKPHDLLSQEECKRAATVALADIVQGWSIRCSGHTFDAGKLFLAKCKRSDGLDVSEKASDISVAD